MALIKITLLFVLVNTILAYRPLQPHNSKQYLTQKTKGTPLYLTPYIESGDVETGRSLAQVTEPLEGLSGNEQPESYAGFLTVNKNYNSNMFFWFFPATEVDPSNAPVVIWLQGGPGGSSMFGLLEIHGPFQSVYDSNFNTKAEVNPHAWTKKSNLIYIDNPVGAGYSYSTRLPTSQSDVADELYEFLIQWFKLFPQYQSNKFFPFGESYAGKFVPTIAKKIHDENPNADIKINLAGLGIGDGFMSPPDSSVYAEYLYQVGMVGETELETMLEMETQMKQYAASHQWENAWREWNSEFGYFLNKMGCNYYYAIDQCGTEAEEDNYEEFIQLSSTRSAIHVGNLQFGSQSGDVYYSMIDDFMRSERETVEFLLEHYKVLIYDGNFDIICNHSGVLKMFEAMTNWSGKNEYYNTDRTVWKVGGHTAGYLKSVRNLRMFVMRNAGHMVPRSQPEFALDMFDKFISGRM